MTFCSISNETMVSAMTTATSLLVRNLPDCLTEEQILDFFHLFKANSVRYMGTTGKLKHCVFATFPAPKVATDALKQIHQLKLLNFTLRAEYTKDQELSGSSKGKELLHKAKDSGSASSASATKTIETQSHSASIPKPPNETSELSSKVNSLSKSWDLHYSINDNLFYRYPVPSDTTLQNIVHCLASVPKFYVQVLHLMNKMHLPPPFGELTTRPPIEKHAADELSDNVHITSEESELESSDDDNSRVRRKGRLKPKAYWLRMVQQICPMIDTMQIVAPVKRTKKLPTEVYAKRLRSQLKLADPLTVKSVNEPDSTPASRSGSIQDAFEVVREQAKQVKVTLPAQVKVTLPAQVTLSNLSQQEDVIVDNTFGKISHTPMDMDTTSAGLEGSVEPPPTQLTAEGTEATSSPYITTRELHEGRLNEEETAAHAILKKHTEGEPCGRLYVKNLAKQTTLDQLKYIFGRYVNWDNDEEAEAFNIRHMTEGRMKGQAFVTLPHLEAARAATAECHAYLLNGKPMAVAYAKSNT